MPSAARAMMSTKRCRCQPEVARWFAEQAFAHFPDEPIFLRRFAALRGYRALRPAARSIREPAGARRG
jgi:hypothetical protein